MCKRTFKILKKVKDSYRYGYINANYIDLFEA